MVDSIRETEKTLGKVNYSVTEHEKASRVFRRSLFAIEDIAEGEMLTEKNIRSIRPGYGLPPKYFYEILGKKALVNICKGTPLHWDLFQ
jgi:sialic acid synthase SpsE